MTATLNNLIANDNGLRVLCDTCSRVADMDVPKLIHAYGGAMTLPEIGRRARCKVSGGRGGSVQGVAVRW